MDRTVPAESFSSSPQCEAPPPPSALARRPANRLEKREKICLRFIRSVISRNTYISRQVQTLHIHPQLYMYTYVSKAEHTQGNAQAHTYKQTNQKASTYVHIKRRFT